MQSYAALLYIFSTFRYQESYNFISHAAFVQAVVLGVYIYRDVVPITIGKPTDAKPAWLLLLNLTYTSFIAPFSLPRYLVLTPEEKVSLMPNWGTR